MIFQNEYGTFSTAFPSSSDFVSGWNGCGLYQEGWVTDATLTHLYYLLYSRYNSSVYACNDDNQFKYKCYALIYTDVPKWAKQVEIQSILRDLTEEDIMKGTRQVFNKALNPNTTPASSELEEVPYINEQNTSGVKRDKLTAYSNLWAMLSQDGTEELLNKFGKLFTTTFVYNLTGEEDD